MENLLYELENLLRNDGKYFTEKGLLKNKITELALKSDKDLLSILLNNQVVKNHFFTEIDINNERTLVFDKEKFISFINNKEFLPGSYTSFKNQIGLKAKNKLLVKENDDVSLVWPYKDCVLEGGQDFEDQKRNEIFYNEILSLDEIDRLFEPKVLTKAKKIDRNGEHNVQEIASQDNFIIKGNNLLVLHCLENKYRGKIKLIYLDPPYNTGDDSFGYNDKFNHSSWLTFMKNRLAIAKDLLTEDGAIFVQIDHHEIGYLTVLMDEIFGSNNKVQIISVKVASSSGFKAINPGPIDVSEYILFYAKNKKYFNFRRNYIPVSYHKNYNKYIEKDNDISKWKIIPLKQKVLKYNGLSEQDLKDKFQDAYKYILENLIANFAFKNPENVASVRDLHKPTQKVKLLQAQSREYKNKVIPYKKQNGDYMYLYNGGALAFYSSKINIIDGQPQVTELLSNFWDHISWAGIANEGGVKLKNGKKPEKLIKQIIEIVCDRNNDIVMDFFLASGTTAAVAHKMGLTYIGVEQLDYDKNDSIVRLKNVINGDQTGISPLVKWQGDGSFIYMELKEWNENYIELIKNSNTTANLLKIYERMKKEAFFRYDIDFSKFDKDKFSELSLEDQKNILCECLDKNHLYVNLSEIEDTTYNISDEDKKLNKLFYNQEI